MKRCRCILNRLSVSEDAGSFLENTNFTKEELIYQPAIWLRLINDRLDSKYYDNEFDFAYDVRLIIYSILTSANQPLNALTKAAIQLSLLFEYLFAQWIINVQDQSIDDLAKGPWDEWSSLKYYEKTNDTDVQTDSLNCCTSCKDSISTFDNSEGISATHLCPRCTNAALITFEELSKNPKVKVETIHLPASDYNCENFGGVVFIPLHPDKMR